MERIRFSCSGCGTKLGASPDLVGKPIACPKCHHKATVPAPEAEVASDPPIRFPCTKCGAKLQVKAQLAGRAIPCPRCGDNTLVPDADEVGSYGLAGTSSADDDEGPARPEPPLAKWWPDGSELGLPLTWRTKLATARAYTEDERWAKALELLNDLFQKELREKTKVGTHILRKPLAFCLGKWAAREIDRLDDERAKLSKPIRQVLKMAAETKRWNGSLSSRECPLCHRQLQHLVGTIQIRTVAGSAYLCCARPTKDDDTLVRRVDKICKKLTLAGGLDPDNRQVPKTIKMLPDWYRAVDMIESGWTKAVVDDDEGGSSAGRVGAGFGEQLAGHAVGEILSSLLFG